ncbi:signal peptide peptidase SppA [Macrococcoides bohemicum]|uniref:Signal peptide peptidase SppA n=2 Tax=Macrococcoides bohemicum TaxID=1903056 RepID=A0AAE7Q6C8_9STAP|nr:MULTISPECIES: signal peptide peptidase SppA [Macrococcus]ATD30006.1 signal peptide peptidase SppA [Macrococcus sp. IME1552]MBC9873716.1 signal peptide peptidase SppA [Macrococcus bohemicus]QRN50295.1 signal peptide peptidase SppA [Macrococcus bohemicus]QYA41713.1 signal peptide peptidase SppA [Macrococcus bohemicus]QYA44142.1 signal peptide peptidase SppA [Macrococcus bohemicus]
MSKRVIAMIIAAVLFILGTSVSFFTSAVTTNFSKSFEEATNMKNDELSTTVLEGTDGANQIARVEVDGVIQDTGVPGLFDEAGYNHTKTLQTLEQIKDDDNIKGLMLVVNSPGGGVYESAEIHDAIKAIKKSGKKVYVTMKNMAASGGYYISAPADKIYASSETITGSLGVIMQSMNYKELADKYGVKFNTIKSGPHKDIMSPTKEMDEEERKILQSFVDESYNAFVKVISEGRHIDTAQVKKIADGRIYSGLQAKKLNLIDEIGMEKDALKAMKEDLKAKNAEVIEFNADDSFFGKDFFAANTFVKQLMGQSDVDRVQQILSKRQGLEPMYLYGE